MKNSVLLSIASAILLTLLTMPAHAQATRTWVSGVGDDANPCSRTAPCKTFAGAISKTAAGGEINCLDPGGFGAITITKSITLFCEGISNGGVLVAGTNGIVVAAGATDKVVLDGLDIEGLAGTTTPGLNGVSIISGLAVYIIHCSIRDFGQNGVNVSSSTAHTRVFIKDSFIENTVGGVNVQGNGAATVISNTLIDGSTTFDAQATAGNTVALVRSILTNSPTGLNLMTGAIGILVGPSNVIEGTVNGSPTSAGYR
jgi:hypothetical protein